MQKAKVGLFGTCGNSTWRDAFVPALKNAGASYFNPQFFGREYTNADAAQESFHLHHDDVLLFPATAETSALVTLAEIGQAMAQIVNSKDRHLIIFVAPTVNSNFVTDPQEAKWSNKVRKVVLSHMAEMNHPRIHIVSTFEEMFDKMFELI